MNVGHTRNIRDIISLLKQYIPILIGFNFQNVYDTQSQVQDIDFFYNF